MMGVEPLRSDVVLDAPRMVVWDALADLEGVSRWNPAIDRAECLSAARGGVGARRRCWMAPSGSMTETVTEWEPGRRITITVDEASPLRSGIGRFQLTDAERGTRLTASFDYDVRFGPLGPVIDRLVVHRQLAAGWRLAIDGLREHVEALARS